MNAGFLTKRQVAVLDPKNYTGIALGYAPDNRYIASAFLAAYAMARASDRLLTEFVEAVPIWVYNPDQPNVPPADFYPVGIGAGDYHEYEGVTTPFQLVRSQFTIDLFPITDPENRVLWKFCDAVAAGKRAAPAGFEGQDNIWPLLGYLPGNLPMLPSAEWVQVVREAFRVFAYALLGTERTKEELRHVQRLLMDETELWMHAESWTLENIKNPLTWDGYAYWQVLYAVSPAEVIANVKFWTELGARSRKGFADQRREAEESFQKAASGPVDLGFGQSVVIVRSNVVNTQFGPEARKRSVPLFIAVQDGGRHLIVQTDRDRGISLEALPKALETVGFPEFEIRTDQWSGSVIVGGTRRQPLELRVSQGTYNVEAAIRALGEVVAIEYRKRELRTRTVSSQPAHNGHAPAPESDPNRNLRRRHQSRPASSGGGNGGRQR